MTSAAVGSTQAWGAVGAQRRHLTWPGLGAGRKQQYWMVNGWQFLPHLRISKWRKGGHAAGRGKIIEFWGMERYKWMTGWVVRGKTQILEDLIAMGKSLDFILRAVGSHWRVWNTLMGMNLPFRRALWQQCGQWIEEEKDEIGSYSEE